MRTLYVISFLFVFLGLSGCTSMPSPEGKPLPAMTFKHLSPLTLSVKDSEIQINETDNSAGFSLAFDEMMRAYLQRKLKPEGVQGSLLASLDESVIERSHENSENAAIDLFGLGGFDLYEVRVKLRLEHRDDYNQMVYGTVVKAKRLIKISEHASIAEREHAQFEGLEKLFVELDRYVEKVIVQDMKLKLPSL